VSFLGSWALACVAPLVAVAAIAGQKMRFAEGAALVGTAWAMNQAIGFLLLTYPHDFDTAAWGVAIGAAMFAGFAAACLAGRAAGPVGTLAAFASAFAAYEVVLFAATAVLPSYGTFTGPVIGQILVINAVAFVGLLVLYWSAVALHMLRPAPGLAPAAA
jgi:hypothetical protein